MSTETTYFHKDKRTKEKAEGKMMAEIMNGMGFRVTDLTVKTRCCFRYQKQAVLYVTDLQSAAIAALQVNCGYIFKTSIYIKNLI